MGYQGASMFSYVCLLLGTAAVIISIATQHWSTHTGVKFAGSTAGGAHRGLMQDCVDAVIVMDREVTPVTCTDRYRDLYNEAAEGAENIVDGNTYVTGNVKVWEFTVLVLMAASALFGVLALLVGPCCCNRCGYCLGFYVLFAAIFSGVGVGIYAYKLMGGQAIDSMVQQAQDAINNEESLLKSHFGWSFYLAGIGAILQTIAALLFCVGGRRSSHEYTQHI